MGCGKSKVKQDNISITDPGSGASTTPVSATVTTAADGTLTLDLPSESIIIDPAQVDLGYEEIAGKHFVYINLGITQILTPMASSSLIPVTGKTLLPVLDIQKSESTSPPEEYTLIYQNIEVNTFDKDDQNSYVCKVEISDTIVPTLMHMRVKIKWQRPKEDPVSGPIGLTQKTKLNILTQPNIITDSGGTKEAISITEPFRNRRAMRSGLAVEGFMNDHPLLGKTYAKF